jgi:hypothetical protein
MKALVSGSAALLLAVIFATPTEAQATAMDYGPTVIEITGPVLVAFEKGLRTEVALREALKKQLAERTTKPDFDKCAVELMMNPDSQKFQEYLTTLGTQAKPEELQHRMLRFYAAVQARLEKKCGANARYGNEEVTQAQLEAIERKAVSIAGPIP